MLFRCWTSLLVAGDPALAEGEMVALVYPRIPVPRHLAL
jgi:hypothetical protein